MLSVFRDNGPLRVAVVSAIFLGGFVVFTDLTLRTSTPLLILFGAMVGHDIADDTYDLPAGSNWFVYGVSIVLVGLSMLVLHPANAWFGGLVVCFGLWVSFDGATIITYGPFRTESEHVADIFDDSDGEILLRMQTVNVIYQSLRTAPEAKTIGALATDLDLTESRVEVALSQLEREDYVEQTAGGYFAEPPRWGRLTPVVAFTTWLPRRIVRPFHRIAAHS